ncbi:MAG TPA: hypothetical protein VMU50_01630 [Polyangia bacterium]|nr:hypothetical protein [Polyangia bacterium]
MRSAVVSRLAVLAAAVGFVLGCSSDNSGSAGSGGKSGGSAGSGGDGNVSTGGGGGGSSGSGGTSGADAPGGTGGMIDNATLTWKAATLTDFTSYPDPGSAECIQFSGCMYEGMFAAFGDEVKSQQWVMDHNIASVHQKDFNMYVGRTLRLRKDDKMIDVVVYDECSDSDCNGCCTRNAMPSGFLIDIEKYTFMRFGVPDGQIEWACLDCP